MMTFAVASNRTAMLKPEDLAVLQQILNGVELPTDTAATRELRALSLVQLFQSGNRTSAQLLNAMGYEAAQPRENQLPERHGLWRRAKSQSS